MPEDDLESIGLLRRRVNQLEATLTDFGRRLAVMEGRERERTVPRVREPMRGTGSARDPELQQQTPDLAEAERRRQTAYDEANARYPLPLSGTREVEPKED